MSLPRTPIELLERMVSFDTVTPHHSHRPTAEQPLAAELARLAEAWGLETTWLPVPDHGPNLLVTHKVAADAPWLLLDSHLDTVGVEGMTIDPFQAQQRDGKIFGRGAADTKGSGTAMLWALAAAHREATAGTNIGLLFTVGEEHLQIGARYFAEHQLATLGWRPLGAIVGEPTRLEIISATNGLARWKIRTHGVAAHSSAPDRGRSAIRDMMRVLAAIEDEYIARLSARHPLTGAACCSVNIIHGGSQINVIPDHCEVEVDRRLVPGEDPDEVLPTVERVLDRLRQQDPGLDVDVLEPAYAPPLDDLPNRHFSEQVALALGYTGRQAQPAGAPYVTDGNRLGAVGIPTVVFGPGDIAQAHTRDEWIAGEQLAQGVIAYRKLIERPASHWQTP